MINQMTLEAGKVKYFRKSIQQNHATLNVETVYILNGLSTIQDVETVVDSLIASFHKDVTMRRDIVRDIPNATADQMGVYASAWKYGPLLDREIEQRFRSLMENEL